MTPLINYEMLKRQNEQGITTLSGLEARVQDRLAAYASSSPSEVYGPRSSSTQSLCTHTLRKNRKSVVMGITLIFECVDIVMI